MLLRESCVSYVFHVVFRSDRRGYAISSCAPAHVSSGLDTCFVFLRVRQPKTEKLKNPDIFVIGCDFNNNFNSGRVMIILLFVGEMTLNGIQQHSNLYIYSDSAFGKREIGSDGDAWYSRV